MKDAFPDFPDVSYEEALKWAMLRTMTEFPRTKGE